MKYFVRKFGKNPPAIQNYSISVKSLQNGILHATIDLYDDFVNWDIVGTEQGLIIFGTMSEGGLSGWEVAFETGNINYSTFTNFSRSEMTVVFVPHDLLTQESNDAGEQQLPDVIL